MVKIFFAAAVLFVFSALPAMGQTTPVKPSVVSGEVVSVDAAKLVINAANGSVEAKLTEATEYKRVSAENPSLKTATPAAFSDIAVGDRVMVTGILAADGRSLPARAVYVMTKSDISQRNAKQVEQWRTRGVGGRVVSVNQEAKQIVMALRPVTSGVNVTITLKDGAKVLRYAPDSILYDEAKVSSLADIRAGDDMRALGERSADGASFTAEEVLAGSFQTIAGKVKSVDTQTGEIIIRDLDDKKDITVVTGKTTVLMKKFPPEMAERMAMMQAGGGAGGGVRPPGQGGVRPPGAGPRPAGGPGGAGGIDAMLERMPDLTLAEVKPGEMIAFSSTKGTAVDRVKAIKLVSGVEPFIRMAQTSAAASGGRGGQGVSGSFTIPGLDGAGF